MLLSCNICGSTSTKVITDYPALARVTSDCKPFPAGGNLYVCQQCGQIQKRQNAELLDEISGIYLSYEAYYQSDGEEQKCWNEDAGRLSPRSEVIAITLKNLGLFKASGNLLDIGCGVGSTLSQFHYYFPKWRLSGVEFDRKNEEKLNNIKHFDTLFTGNLSDINETFDCVSFIHSLEHMTDPLQCLKQALNLCNEEGLIIIQVPDFKTNRYDILVADHLFHFTLEQLSALLESIGFEVCFQSNSLVKREITLIGRKLKNTKGKPELQLSPALAHTNEDLLQANIDFLNKNIDILNAEIAVFGRLSVFGTSIASVWITSQFGQYIDCYLDEDKDRVGSTFFNLPVLHPGSQCIERVFFPFTREIGLPIATRYPNNIVTAIYPE
jgi:2-polyprenyl-3-methyl-5-hydroxy-6-metoxy-1,4-benzoquinol methylase